MEDAKKAVWTSKKNKDSTTLSKFPDYFFEALGKNKGDSNGDGRTSIEEAFIYAADNDELDRKNSFRRYILQRQVPNMQYENLNPVEVYLKWKKPKKP